MRSSSAAQPAAAARVSAQTPILILGLAGLSMHHGALGAMRSAGRLGISVFHLQPERRRLPIGRSRYSHGALLLPPDGEEGTLPILREFGVRHGPTVLLAVDDASAMFVADHSDALEDASFLFPRQPTGLARALAGKRAMHGLCLEHAIPTPAAAFPVSEAEVCAHAADAVFPIVVKRIDASQPAASSAPNVLVARDREQLLAAYRAMESPRAPNVMLQEYIPGAPDSNWMFNGYFDSRSECRMSFAGQKLRQSPPDAGATTLGACLTNATLQETTIRLMRAVGYRGIVDADYRFDDRDGQYKLLDVNPRIGSSFRLFTAADGTDVLRAMYLDLTDQPVSTLADRRLDGRRWIVEPQDLRSSLIYIRRRELKVGAWLRSLRHIDETAWWAREDPLPFLAMVSSLLGGQLRRRLGTRRARREHPGR